MYFVYFTSFSQQLLVQQRSNRSNVMEKNIAKLLLALGGVQLVFVANF